MEIYEFSMKNRFNGYVKEERRMFAYPMISFVFGIRNIDDGNVFDMSDRGTLHLTPIRLEQRETLEFFRVFIENLSTRPDLFSSNEDLKKDFQAFYQVRRDEIRPVRRICFLRFSVDVRRNSSGAFDRRKIKIQRFENGSNRNDRIYPSARRNFHREVSCRNDGIVERFEIFHELLPKNDSTIEEKTAPVRLAGTRSN